MALWDRNRRRLFCARDLIGTRPFYYYQSNNSFCFASEIRQLLVLEEIPRRPNEGMIGEYLVSRMVSNSETQFEGIMRLPPATCLLVENGRVEKRDYWDPTAVPSIRYERDEEYADHLAELLSSAVASRLKSQFPVGIQLSGGVDSSSVVAVAADLQRNQGVDCPSLEALSLVFPGWECDESEFIDALHARAEIEVVAELEALGEIGGRIPVGDQGGDATGTALFGCPWRSSFLASLTDFLDRLSPVAVGRCRIAKGNRLGEH